jgi:hypothetical protein
LSPRENRRFVFAPDGHSAFVVPKKAGRDYLWIRLHLCSFIYKVGIVVVQFSWEREPNSRWATPDHITWSTSEALFIDPLPNLDAGRPPPLSELRHVGASMTGLVSEDRQGLPMKASETRESPSLWSVRWPCNLHPPDAQVVPVLLKKDRGIERAFIFACN